MTLEIYCSCSYCIVNWWFFRSFTVCAVHVMNDHILELNDEINNGKDELKVAKAT